MRFGAYTGSDVKRKLPWNNLKNLDPSIQFGGTFVIIETKRQAIPKRSDVIIIAKITDNKKFKTMPSDDPITAKIWRYPASLPAIATESILAISSQKAKMKTFNGKTTLHCNYSDIEITSPQQLKQQQRLRSKSRSRSSTPKQHRSRSTSRSSTPQQRQRSRSRSRSSSLTSLSSSRSKSPRQRQNISLKKHIPRSFSELSSPESTPSLSPNANYAIEKCLIPKIYQIEKEQDLQSALGIEASLAISIPDYEKVVFNYAEKISKEIISYHQIPSKSLPSPRTPPSSNKRTFSQMEAPNDKSQDEMKNSEDKSIERETERTPKKRKISYDRSDSLPPDLPSTPKKLKSLLVKCGSTPIEITMSKKKRIEKNRLEAIRRRQAQKLRLAQSKISKIFVVDLETTGNCKAKKVSAMNGDVIVEVGIVVYDRNVTKEYSVKPVYHAFILPESYEKCPDNWRDSWIFDHGMDIEMILKYGKKAEVALAEIRNILNGEYVTSYNIDFDLDRFLKQEPYSVEYKAFDCIMEMCGKAMSMIRPSLKEAVHEFMGWDFRWGAHNAMEDALTAAKILREVFVGDDDK